MRYLTVFGVVLVAWAAAACGDDRTEPVTRISATDVRDRQSRRVPPQSEVMRLMVPPEGPGRIIYEPPVDLTFRPRDTAVTAPFGITAAPDSAGRNPTRPAPGRGEGQTPRDVRQPDTTQRARPPE
jgi:hypothetical protein